MTNQTEARLLKITGVMGSGMIGVDPYANGSWSGSSPYFFRECERQHFLSRAFGVEAPRWQKLPLMLRNHSFDRKLWVQKFYLDTAYYRCLERALVQALTPAERQGPILQLGGIYNLRRHLPADTYLCSYHDGNLAEAVRSPHFYAKVGRSKVDKALAFEREVYQGLNRIFVMSHYLKRSFVADFGVSPDKVTVVGAGMNLPTIPSEPPVRTWQPKILFIGVDFERKGGQDLLAAFASVRKALPAAELHIVGPSKIDIPAGLSAGVVCHGFLTKSKPEDQARLESLFAQCSLFALPSRYEPFGIAPLEAMAHGMPCVLTDRWAFPDMVQPGVNGELVPCEAPQLLAESLTRLLQQPEALARMGQAARALALGEFTWEAVVNRIRETIVADMGGAA
jgi:starch synthase